MNNPIDFTGAKVYHSNGIRGDNIVIAIVDTGVAPHPDLTILDGWGINGINPREDKSGHGTHVAGIAAGKKYGVAPGAKILPVRISPESSSNAAYMMSGLEYLIDWRKTHKERLVVNISFSGTTTPQVLSYIDTLVSLDVPVCVASGNDSKEISELGFYQSPIVVGNMSDSSHMNGTSNCFGDETDCVTIGTQVNSCTTSGGYKLMSGTSMASPAVAGMMALILNRWNSISEPAATAQLLRTGRDELVKCKRGSHYIPHVNFSNIDFGSKGVVTNLNYEPATIGGISSGKALVVRNSAGGSKIGNIKNGRKVIKLSADGGYTQIAYPISSKETGLGWVSSKYLK